MDKIAQERGIFNKLREKVNMPGAYLEGFFKPELDRVMTSLKELDDRIRAVLTGKKIGTADAPTDAVAIKDLLKNARTNFNRREYMTGVAELGRFHKKLYDISQDIGRFFVDVNKIHHKFLFEGMDGEKMQNLRKHMDETMKKANDESEYFIKEAGIMDFFYNIGTKRGRSLAAWEKKYPKQTKDLREGGDRLINEAQKLLDNTLTNLKQMATARATRRPDEYMDVANRIKGDFEKFDNGKGGFRDYYNNAITPWLKIKDEIDARENPKEEVTPVPGTPKPSQIEMGGDQGSPTVPLPSPGIIGGPPVGVPPGVMSSPPATPPARPGVVETARDTIPAPPPVHEPEENIPFPLAAPPPVKPIASVAAHQNLKTAHQAFYKSLEILSKEDPKILAKYISRYAISIQAADPETAIDLFKIAKRING
jgi:hypothetical protein